MLHKGRLSAYVVYLIFSGGTSLFFTLSVTVNLVYQVEVAHLNPLQLVLVGTALETICFLAQVPTGVLADSYSRRFAIILGTFITGAGFILEGSIPRFETIVLAQSLFGIGATFVSGAEEAWVADELGQEQIGTVFIRSQQIGLIGSLIAAILSAVLASIRLNLPLIAGGSLYIVLAIFLVFYMPERGFVPKAERQTWQEMIGTFRNGMHLVRGSYILLMLFLVQLFFGLSSEGYDRLSTAHFLADFTFPALFSFKPVVWFSIFSIAGTLLSLGVAEGIRRRVNLKQQRAIVTALLLLNGLSVGCILLFALSYNFLLAVVAYLSYNVVRGAGRPLLTTLLTYNTSSRTRATVFSMLGQVDALGQIAGGPPVGYIGTILSLRAALVAVSIILSPVVVLFSYAVRKSPFTGNTNEKEDTVLEAP